MRFITFVIVTSLACSLLVTAEDRNVTVEWNPGCDGTLNCNGTNSKGSYSNLVYVKMAGASDVIHILYSDIYGFSMMMFRTNLTAQLSVNWTNFLSDDVAQRYSSIGISQPPSESCGYLFTNIYEFNDTDYSADISKSKFVNPFKTSDLVWAKFSANNSDMGWFEGSVPGKNGTFKFMVKYPGKEDFRDKDLPHLIISSQSTLVDFVIDSIEPMYNMSKFALNTIFLSSGRKVSTQSKTALDDEYTPGTFQLWNALETDENGQVKNYLQWKPIFYSYSPKTLENSTITKQYSLSEDGAPVGGLGYVFFNQMVTFPSLNVSFGLPGNQKNGFFYKFTNYSSFSFTMGLGEPPKEKMSFIVSMVIFVGFGLPALAILVGLMVMIYRKLCRSNTSEFSAL